MKKQTDTERKKLMARELERVNRAIKLEKRTGKKRSIPWIVVDLDTGCLIGLKKALTPQQNIARFDFGICMGAWEGGDKQMITADQFKRDAECKTFTLCRADNEPQFSYSMVRFKKLTADRYKDWTLSVPGKFEQLAKEHTFRQHWYRDGAHFGFEHEGSQVLRPKAR